MKITIRRTHTGTSYRMTQLNYDILSTTTLKGCPFNNYYAIDLLNDLIKMYSWKITPGESLSIENFLNLCSCPHATAYRSIFVN